MCAVVRVDVQGFTHVDPFEDTERHLQEQMRAMANGFTHVDPFEDTERIPEVPLLPGGWDAFHPRRSVRGY